MTSRKYKMYYDYRKRTSGGFFDTIFLSSLLLIGATFIFLALLGGK